ncbi:MFS-type transporter SLC18B1-like [Convolutriloba macropyga]|uniref:MFS-type transporter SLC18B1-like n=1 Tax=Convolutriloba macropyga TaxID=536237 RepID=UPI003F5290CC
MKNTNENILSINNNNNNNNLEKAQSCADEISETTNSNVFFCQNRKSKIVIVLCMLVYMCWGVNTSIIGPFFPTEAEKRGVSRSTTGLITATLMFSQWFFAMVFFFVASDRNKKCIFYFGFLFAGVMCIAFGQTYRLDQSEWFIASCYVIRIVIGLGGACTWSTGAPIMIPLFPKKAGLIFSMCEISTAVGMMIGPALSSYLFSIGGYQLPFITTGLLEITFGLLSVISIQSLPKTKHRKISKAGETFKGSAMSMLSIAKNPETTLDFKSAIKFLSLPGIWLVTFPLLAVLSQFGFFQVSLAPHLLKEFKIDGSKSGIIFLVHAGASAITCFVYGILIDKGYTRSTFLSCVFLTSLGYFILGLPCIAFENYSKITLFFGLSILGLTSYGGYLPCYFLFQQIAQKSNFVSQEKLRIYICTWVTFCYSFGLISGQFFVGGLFFAHYDFYQSNMFLAIITMVGAIMVACFEIRFSRKEVYSEFQEKSVDEREAQNVTINLSQA